MILRCGACQQEMSAGPELMGQIVACPACGTTVRVPGATAAPVVVEPVVQGYGGRLPVPPPSDGGALVHRCPRCGSDVEHGNTLCPRCGTNIKRARKKRSRRF